MRHAVIGVLFVLFLIPSAAGALEIPEYNITFVILANGYVNERVSMVFAGSLNESALNYVVLGEISDLAISGGGKDIDYVLEKSGSEYNVKFIVPKGTENLTITFTAKDLVFTKESLYSFFTSLQPPVSEKINVVALLPRGFAVYRDVVYPEGYDMLTDGERIYLKWDLDKSGETAIYFKFYNTHSDYHPLMLAVMGFCAFAIVVYIVVYYRKRVRKEFLRGFTEDERKVLKALSERRVCMQKALEKQFGFSRTKMTRVVKRLEEKGLVERERVGRTNRLFYRK